MTSLDEVLTQVDRLRCGEAVAVFAPIADELAAAHAVGAAHRAINRHAVRLAADGSVSLVPAALARKRSAGVRARGEDVGDLARVIVDALLGRASRDEAGGDGIPADWGQRAAASGVPVGLVSVLATALADRAAQRPTASELAAGLREVCDPLPLGRLLDAQASA
ncbi:hypothetical protein [Cryptosporangium sp. NPDC051539]|uniref:hypothetical protein n=1 Tax=Cryptosporangium sp. NPDC051539 TaxID=3363962 RepID=UPI0037A5D7D4